MHRLLVLLFLVTATPALAQKNDAPTDPEARSRLEIGTERYRLGDYTAAAAEFRAAYAREPHPRLLYNWAQAERLAGNCDAAIPLYKKLLDAPLAEDRLRVVSLHLAECVQRVTEAPAASPTAPAPAPPRAEPPVETPSPPLAIPMPATSVVDTPPWYRDPVGSLLVVGGVVSLGAGLAFYLESNDQLDAAERGPSGQIDAHLEAASLHRSIALVTTVAGTGLLVAGLLRYALHDRAAPRAPAVSIGVGDGATFTIHGSW